MYLWGFFFLFFFLARVVGQRWWWRQCEIRRSGLVRWATGLFRVCQVGLGRGGGVSQQSGTGKKEAVVSRCRPITAAWGALCTWRSPARHTRWRQGSPSARRWSSSGRLVPCACQEETWNSPWVSGSVKQIVRKRRGGSTEHDGALKHRVFSRRGLPKDKSKSYLLTLVEVPFKRGVKDECYCPVTLVWKRNMFHLGKREEGNQNWCD